jgi:hypothetical protein
MAKTRKTRPAIRKARTARVKTGAATPAAPVFEIGSRVERQALTRPYEHPPGAPLYRPLRIYTLDPSVSHRIGGTATVNVPYERLQKGPVGALFEIDPAGAPGPLRAEPIDLDDPYLLMAGGLTPSPANGQFALQMTYAVCSLTYAAFRRALGRDISWACDDANGTGKTRLKVRPFGMRNANAGYSREGGDLSFGYFRASARPAGFTVAKGHIFTALSHDVIAHETTHAILDGLRAAFAVPTNPDVLAFHEGFADIVALLLHFSYAGVVEQAIRESRGAIARGSLLSDVAREFGYARSRAGGSTALRSAIDVEGVVAFDSDVPPGTDGGPVRYDASLEPHQLGSVLVSAIFEAFVTVVRRKGERLMRIAGLDPRAVGQAQLGDELVRALADEASGVASRFLDICIRAIDYCPPVDIEMGEYLRALITADADLVQDDKWGYREALMRSFRRREIFPNQVQFMTEDAVRWQPPEATLRVPGLAFKDLRFGSDPGHPADVAELRRQATALGDFVTSAAVAPQLHLLVPGRKLPVGVTYASPPMVESIRCARRTAPDGSVVFELVAEVTQSYTATHDGDLVESQSGCTLVIDPHGEIRYAIYKKPNSRARPAQQLRMMRGALKRFWTKRGGRYEPRKDTLRLLHEE